MKGLPSRDITSPEKHVGGPCSLDKHVCEKTDKVVQRMAHVVMNVNELKQHRCNLKLVTEPMELALQLNMQCVKGARKVFCFLRCSKCCLLACPHIKAEPFAGSN